VFATLGDGVELRLLEDRHAAELFRLVDRNRARLRQWLPWLDVNTDPAHSSAFIRRSLTLFAAGRATACGIWTGDVLVGTIDHHDLDPVNRSVAIGYWLDAGHEGRGLVTRAAREMCRRAFADLGLQRVEIRVAVDNARSRRIPVSLGFHEDGTLRRILWLYDHFVDEVVYSLLSDEWSSASRPPAARP
jgi:ribosomal-protein-serine acetyltransferase